MAQLVKASMWDQNQISIGSIYGSSKIVRSVTNGWGIMTVPFALFVALGMCFIRHCALEH